MDIVYCRVCGLDVHKKKIAACASIWEGLGRAAESKPTLER